MIELNGHQYKVALLDTNIVSDMLKDQHGFGRRLLSRIGFGDTIPSLTLYTIKEIQRSPGLYGSLLQFVAVVPTLILKTFTVLLDDEVGAYPTPSKVNPVLLSPLGIIPSEGLSRVQTLRELFDSPDVAARMKELEDGREALLELFKTRSVEYREHGVRPTRKTIRAFGRAVCLDQLQASHPAWLKENSVTLDLDAFPSVKAMAYSVLIRYASDARKPRLSDVLDVPIAGVLPYVDVAGIESHQAEVLRKIGRMDPFLTHVDVFTIREIGGSPDKPD